MKSSSPRYERHVSGREQETEREREGKQRVVRRGGRGREVTR